MLDKINAHWGLIAMIAGPILGTAIASLASIYGDPDNDPATPPPTSFGRFTLFLKLWWTVVVPAGYQGIGGTRFSIPVLHLPGREGPPPLPPAVLVLALVGALLAGCAFGKCLLGKLPSSAQPILVDATQALIGPNWEQSLASIAATVGEGALDCAVQAIATARQSAHDAQVRAMADSSIRMAPPVDFVLEHATAWLVRHPAKACKENKPPASLAVLGLLCTESPGIREVTCRDQYGNEFDFTGTLRLVAVAE